MDFRLAPQAAPPDFDRLRDHAQLDKLIELTAAYAEQPRAMGRTQDLP
jgi:hypothetical protein